MEYTPDKFSSVKSCQLLHKSNHRTFFSQHNEVNIYASVMPGFHPEIFQEEFINI